MRKIIDYVFISLILIISCNLQAQKQYKAASVVFYNVENLYDTIKSADIINGNLPPDNPKYQVSVPEDSALASGLDVYRGELTFAKLKGKQVVRQHILTDEFYYKGTKVWNSKKYNEKLTNLSKVFSEIGVQEAHSLPAIIGLAEIENEHVLKDLCTAMKNHGGDYGFAHFNSFDARGVDVGLLYNKQRFAFISQKRFQVDLTGDTGLREYTRDILMVEGLLDGERMFFLVNHWPSRRGGEQRSLPRRMAAAKVLKFAMDSIQKAVPNAKILAMGDFNDDPNSPSIKKGLNTVSKKENVKANNYFSPAEELFKKGMGTLAYQDSFNFFDQNILSPALAKPNDGYFFLKMNVYSPTYLVSQYGQWKGYPFRSFSGDNYTGGYSDHYPVYTILLKEIK
ncbi:MAG: endonuclease [Flavobacteriaceae bacterium]|jgi:hypothetical protein|nr:endonuclease [Flavobacteriaceae bacterium]